MGKNTHTQRVSEICWQQKVNTVLLNIARNLINIMGCAVTASVRVDCLFKFIKQRYVVPFFFFLTNLRLTFRNISAKLEMLLHVISYIIAAINSHVLARFSFRR